MKRLYISAFILYACLATIHIVWIMLHQAPLNNTLIWLSAELATIPIVVVFIYIFMPFVARTSRLISIDVFALVALALSVYAITIKHEFHWLALTYTLVSAIGWLIYNHWYAKFNRKPSDTIAVGKVLPSFIAKNEHGKAVQSRQFIGNYTVFLFYRGNWCPLCSAQIKELAKGYQKLKAQNINVVLISPQPAHKTKSLADSVSAPFVYLVDEGNQIATQLNIADAAGIPLGMELLGYDTQTVMPTVIITDNMNKIIFTDQTDNYRVRPEPTLFAEIIAAHKADKKGA